VYIRFLKVSPVNKWKQKRKTMRLYDLTAEMYDRRYAEEQKVKYKAALKHILINSDSKVLDVGCGTGLLFSHIAAKAQTVLAIDISSKLLQQAKKRNRGFCRVHLVQADADHLPFINNQFNVLFAFTVLQNMPKPLETLNEIKRNAQQGAVIGVTGLKKVFSLEALQALLQDAGLQIVYIEDDEQLKCYVAVTVKC
jgi:ubiquinone/menaquinone biosynthesis C-methylase UbiE